MDRHYHTTLLLLVVLLAGCATIPAAPTETASPVPTATGERTEYEVTVTEVVDGDTMTVAYRNGSTETIRLLGVDTPEVHVENDPAEFDGVPDTDRGREWLRDWGHKASEYARSEIAGEQVRATGATKPASTPAARSPASRCESRSTARPIGAGRTVDCWCTSTTTANC